MVFCAVSYRAPGVRQPVGTGLQMTRFCAVGFHRDVTAMILGTIHKPLPPSLTTAFRTLSITQTHTCHRSMWAEYSSFMSLMWHESYNNRPKFVILIQFSFVASDKKTQLSVKECHSLKSNKTQKSK